MLAEADVAIQPFKGTSSGALLVTSQAEATYIPQQRELTHILQQ